MPIATRLAACLLTVATMSATAVTGATAAQASTPQETMTAGLVAVAADINALVGSGVSGEDAQQAADEVLTRNGFSATEITRLDQAIAAGGGVKARGGIIELIRLFDDNQNVCVGQIVNTAQTWTPGDVMCVSRDQALTGAAGVRALSDTTTVARNVQAIAASDPTANGAIQPGHVWQAVKEARLAKGKAPKSWDAGRGVGRGSSGGVKALGKGRYLIAEQVALATGQTAVCVSTLTIKASRAATGLPQCVLTAQ